VNWFFTFITMKKSICFAAFLFLHMAISAQETKRVLFLGNSYTGVNNLPQMVADVAQSLGDSIFFDSHTPGGHTFQGHTTNAITQAKIAQGGWDYVVLQEQSQLPAFPYSQFSMQSLPYAITLVQQIRAANSCAKPLFYMTWGRKNGDQSNCANFPQLCTYAGMQQQLRTHYLLMADTTNAEVAPVGAVWRDVRNSYPTIELYQTDESHPSVAGSYLAACTFYASIFHKSPVGAAAAPTMLAQDALAIQQQAAATVFDSLAVWKIDTLKPQVNFTISAIVPPCTFQFDANSSTGVDSVYWHFGDGTTGSGFIINRYFNPGVYTICAVGFKDCITDTFCLSAPFCIFSVNEDQLQGIAIYPNPTTTKIRVAQYGQSASQAHYKIYNTQGALLMKDNDASEIDVSHLAKGLYILEVTMGGASSRQRFVKE